MGRTLYSVSVKWCTVVTKENNIKGPQRVKITTWYYSPAAGYISKGNEINMSETFALPCLLKHFSQELRHGSNLSTSVDEWIKRMCYKRTVGCSSGLEENTVWSLVTTWMKWDYYWMKQAKPRETGPVGCQSGDSGKVNFLESGCRLVVIRSRKNSSGNGECTGPQEGSKSLLEWEPCSALVHGDDYK